MVTRFNAVLLLVVAMGMWSNRAPAQELPHYTLSVRITPQDHSIEGKGILVIPAGTRTRLDSGNVTIEKLLINEKKYGTVKPGTRMPVDAGKKAVVVELEFRASFPLAPVPENVENVGVIATNLVDLTGVMLLSGWYPAPGVPCIYQLTAEVPQDLEAVSESDSTTVSVKDTVKVVRFKFPHPTREITLVAGNYRVQKQALGAISLRTYFFPESADLGGDYLKHATEYIKLYEAMLGRFPYETFSIAENRLQTGYSFPTFTLLGSQVIRLPFIVKTSLGHEILHQWFGNYVHVDYEKGNWSEGLTTYLADHWYESLEGRGAEYRKKLMIDYRNYVDPTKEISLAEFKNREDLGTKAIGYGKSAMIFHMLRKTIGDEAFFAGLRKLVADHAYQQVSWEQIKECFVKEREKSKVGAHFFEQWVERKGVPSLTVTDPQVVFRNGSYVLSFHVVQGEENFKVDIPARLLTDDGEERFVIKVDQADVRFEKQLTGRPLVLIIDEDYDMMRRLAEAEVPPVISAFTGSKENIVVVPEQDEQTYADVVKFFRHQGFEVREHVSDQNIKEKSILLLSTENYLYRRFFADAPLPDTGFAVKVHRNPLNPTKVMVVFHGKDGGELRAAYRKIFHYGNYSFLHFKQGTSIAKETEKTENGIVVSLGTSVEAVETRNALDLDEVVGKIKDQGIIYIGENHTEYAHHVIQCEIIRRLAREGKRLVIGMEMFQRPFQRYIDQYIRGEISEEAFLKKTEYFKRWGFDYNFYRDILHLARAKRLPVIALNIRKEIVEKVAKQGINSLSKAEYAEVPEDMDMTNQNYRTFLQGVFAQHAETEAKDFDNFFQSQIIWDESMAHTVVKAMGEHPGFQVIVLAGNGHLQNSWGIPDRVMRLTGQRGLVILNGGEEGIDKKLADFVLFPGQMRAPDSPKLLVELVEKEGGVTVKEVMKGGPAERAGIKAGDIIKKVGDREITEIADVKIAFLSKRKGGQEKVMILRGGVIPPGLKALEINVLF